MASNITLTPETADSASGIVEKTLYGNKDAAIAAGANYVYTQWSMASPSGNQLIPYAGYRNVDAKYMASNTNRLVINGYIIDPTADSDETIASKVLDLLLINKAAAKWSVTLGSTSLVSSRKAVILNITGNGIGDGTGPRFYFTIELQDLGRA